MTRIATHKKKWTIVMLMLGGGWCLGLKRGENRWEREKEEREENINNEREEREISGKVDFFFYYYYNWATVQFYL